MPAECGTQHAKCEGGVQSAECTGKVGRGGVQMRRRGREHRRGRRGAEKGRWSGTVQRVHRTDDLDNPVGVILRASGARRP